MVVSVAAAYADSARLTARQATTREAPRQPAAPADEPAADQTGKSPLAVEDIVSLSPAAQSALVAPELAAAPPPKAIGSYYEQFFPVRDGYSATALAAAIDDPGAETFSAGKTLGEVAGVAGAAMDAKYAAMRADGQPFDFNSREGKDWYSLLGDLDRRALYAVSSNQGGLFTEQEQDIAQSIMSGQQGWAMGLPNGPTRLVEGLPDRFMGDHAARFKAAVQWLDRVSNDEKTSISWAANRAAAQQSYELTMEGRGETPENLDSENPLAKLIKEAMATMKGNLERGLSTGRLETDDDLKRQPWFAGFEDRLDTAIQQTQDLYQTAAAA